MLVRDSIYTRKLALRGHTMPEALQANLHFVRHASGIMDKTFVVANVSQTMADVSSSDKLESIARKDFVVISPDAPFSEILSAMHFKRAPVALVGEHWMQSRRPYGSHLRMMRDLHSRDVGDYVTWLTFGAAAFGLLGMLFLRS